MVDTIIIRCSTCGHEIGKISNVTGDQQIGCSHCGGTTQVHISSDGSIRSYALRRGRIPKPES